MKGALGLGAVVVFKETQRGKTHLLTCKPSERYSINRIRNETLIMWGKP